jgi:hypothetical protein
MAINTEIMVLDEVWYLVDYDQASVPGIIYMSFTETNFNEQRDSAEEGIANIDKLANWKINMLENRIVEPGAEFNLDCTLFKNGVVQKIAPEILLEGNLTMTDDGKIKAGLSGSGIITARYRDIIKK